MTVRFPEELDALERLSLIDISYSRLSTFLQCEQKYFFSYVLLEPRVFGAAAALGSSLHTVLENTDFTTPLDLQVLQGALLEAREIHDPDHQIPEDLMVIGNQMLSEFVDRHEGEAFDIMAKEMPFAIVVGRGLITGYIDRVDQTPHKLYVLDYKSGVHEEPQKTISTNLQLGIYALAVSKYFPNKPVRADLYYLRSGNIKGHEYSPQDLINIENKLIDIIDQMIEKEDHKATQIKWPCKFCDYRKGGQCSVGMKRYKD